MPSPSKQLKEIEDILNVALVPTIHIEYGKRKNDATERPMNVVQRVQWLADELKARDREIDRMAEEAAGEDL